jgi:hypothetical protein
MGVLGEWAFPVFLLQPDCWGVVGPVDSGEREPDGVSPPGS